MILYRVVDNHLKNLHSMSHYFFLKICCRPNSPGCIFDHLSLPSGHQLFTASLFEIALFTMITTLKAKKKKAAISKPNNTTENKDVKGNKEPGSTLKKQPTAHQIAKARTAEEREAMVKEGSKLESKWNWQFSWAKEILRKAISNGDITENHSYDEIHLWHPEIQATDRSKLPGRIRGLREQVTQDTESAKEDAFALEHDRKLYPIPTHNYRGEPRWEGSAAQKQLKDDVAKGLHLTMTPQEFGSRQIFKDYAEDIIREHIYQEIKFQKYCLYRSEKKKSKTIQFAS